MFNLIAFIKTAGYLGIGGIIFAESGLFVGFFLPGDSLLFTAGLLASQHFLNIGFLILVSFLCAVIGDSVGYAFGKNVGPRIFKRPQSFLFNPEHLTRARLFFETYGPKTLILGRFLPVVRTFVPIVAGVGSMKYKTFLTYNVIGGALWTVGLSIAGYFLGKTVPNIDHYLLPIIALIIILSLLPTIIHLIKNRKP